LKYALISDIHSNLPALEAELTDIDSRENVDAVYHLGGYAAVLSVSQVIVVVAVLVPATTSRGHVNGTRVGVDCDGRGQLVLLPLSPLVLVVGPGTRRRSNSIPTGDRSVGQETSGAHPPNE
jgi:hypothetical protein